jgi:hypothetical protein
MTEAMKSFTNRRGQTEQQLKYINTKKPPFGLAKPGKKGPWDSSSGNLRKV